MWGSRKSRNNIIGTEGNRNDNEGPFGAVTWTGQSNGHIIEKGKQFSVRKILCCWRYFGNIIFVLFCGCLDSREENEGFGDFSSTPTRHSSGGGGGGGMLLDGRNNKTTTMAMRGMEGHHFGMLTSMMTGTTRPASSSNTLPVIHGHRHAGSVTVVGAPSSAAAAAIPARPSFIPPSPQSIIHGRFVNEEAKDEPLEPLFLPSSTRIIGPYFESNSTIVYVTARAGEKVMFNCDVALLQGRTVRFLWIIFFIASRSRMSILCLMV